MQVGQRRSVAQAAGGNLGAPVFPDTVLHAHVLVDDVRLYRPGSP